MITNFQTAILHPGLEKYIERIFIIESSGKFPTDDLKLIVPNACPKMVIPFKNGLAATTSEWEFTSAENKIAFIGISDIPASVDFQHPAAGGSVTVEFTPAGAYRFTNIHWRDIKNQICDYTDMGNKMVLELEKRLENTESVSAKVNLVQQFLVRQLDEQEEDPIFEFCIQRITQSKGKIGIKELEKQTGYSARWLNMKFDHKIGISPKNLASIVRFQQYYHSLVNNAEMFFLEKEFYNYYYDQSHFIKDFRRFTGHPPALLSKLSNNYDSVFYKG